MTNKKIFWIGIANNELIKATMSLNDANKEHYWYLNTESFRDILTEEEGEEQAREHLEDGELWKMAVECDNTTSSLSDWVEEVLNIDGWEATLDVTELGDYYLEWSCIGGFEENKVAEYDVLFISKSKFDLFFKKQKDIIVGSSDEKELLELFESINKTQDEIMIAKTYREEVKNE